MRSLRTISIFLAVMFIALTTVYAQLSTTGSITGSVSDKTGAVIPGATVSIVASSTNTRITVKTNSDGLYEIPNVPVGNYSFTAEAPGFKTYRVAAVEVRPAAIATVNPSMQAGSTGTTVTVTGAAPLIDTVSAANAASVSAKQISTLPLNGRNFAGVAAMMPGVQNTSAGQALGTGGRSTRNVLSVNGAPTNTTFYALDGIWDENTGNMAQQTITPNPDSLQEVRILQNNYSAKYSLMGSNVVLLQTKSGTSEFHGAAWEFLRNDALNARPYFAKTVLPYKQNIFGYNLGGPVFIPKVYNTNRNSTFFFWSEQWVALHQVTANLLGITPTAAQRSGIFTSPIKNPSTGLLFPENSAGQYVIPSSDINPNSTAFLNALYPLPNFNGAGEQNYQNRAPTITNQRDDQIKIDRIFGSRFHLLAEYFNEYQKLKQNSIGHGVGLFPVNWETDFTHNKDAQISLSQAWTPNLANTTSISMNIYDLDLDLFGTVTNDQAPGFNPTLPFHGFLSTRLPLVKFSGGIASQGIPDSRPLHHAADLDDIVGDDLMWLHGKHVISAGATVVFNTKRQNVSSQTNGAFSFSGNFTKPASGAVTGNDALADFLLGRASSFTQTSDQVRVPVHGIQISPYIQDRFRVTRNFTATVGLRAYWMPLPAGPLNSETIFVPSAYSASAAPIVNDNGTITPTPGYNPLNGLLFNSGKQGQLPQNFSKQNEWYFGPQAGFAWDVFGNGRTVLRGGYGVSYIRIFTGQDCSFACANNPPRLQTVNLTNPLFPNPVGSGSEKPATVQSLQNADLDIKATQTQSFSVGIERQFQDTWIANLTYAGTVTHHGLATWDRNQPFHFGKFDFNPAMNAGTVSNSIYAPFQGYGSISTDVSLIGSNWNALEVSVRHPVSNTLFFTFAYTYAKDLTDNANAVDIYDPHRYYGDAEGLDFRHTASFTAIYNLPHPHTATGWRAIPLAGWKLAGISTLRSGTAISPSLSISNQGLATRPDRVSGAGTQGAKTKLHWFNTGAFTAPSPGYFGNAGTGIIRGPGLVSFDAALYKDFHITEGRYFELRAEAFNVLNHTSFVGVNSEFGAPSFGEVTSAADPRILELAAHFRF